MSSITEWLETERAYAEAKWPPSHTQLVLIQEGKEGVEKWVGQYIHRAFLLGLDTPLGRQALAKATRTLLAFTEAMAVVYGDPPSPGVPSGEQ